MVVTTICGTVRHDVGFKRSPILQKVAQKVEKAVLFQNISLF